jgi:hypothetical protein
LVVAKQPENVTVVITAEMNIESQTWGKFLALDQSFATQSWLKGNVS